MKQSDIILELNIREVDQDDICFTGKGVGAISIYPQFVSSDWEAQLRGDRFSSKLRRSRSLSLDPLSREDSTELSHELARS